MAEIPEADDEMVHHFQKDYELVFSSGSQQDLDAAKLRLVWALAHSLNRKHNQRGYDMAEEMERRSQTPDDVTLREVQYIKAVALFRLGRYSECRSVATRLIQAHPESRQAVSLKAVAEECLIKEGLVGVGVVGGLLGLAGLAIMAISRSSRS